MLSGSTAGYEIVFVGKYLPGSRSRAPRPPAGTRSRGSPGSDGLLRLHAGWSLVRFRRQPTTPNSAVRSASGVGHREQRRRTALPLPQRVLWPACSEHPRTTPSQPPVSDPAHASDLLIGIDEDVSDKPRWIRRLNARPLSQQERVARLQHRAMMERRRAPPRTRWTPGLRRARSPTR